jgi:CIC family chloride channel protein
MAGVVAGGAGAALTSIAMIFEMTRDYSVVLPMTITVAVSHGVRQALSPANLYTMKLVRRGHSMPQALQANAHLLHHAGEIAGANVEVLPATTLLTTLGARDDDLARPYVVAVDDSGVVGFVPPWRDIQRAAGDRKTLGEVAERDFVLATPDQTLFELIGEMHKARASAAILKERDDSVRAIITKAHLIEAIAQGMELFGD